jgi:hypothetical protein
MDNAVLVTESIAYAKEALVGKWTRWLIFIICGLPMALLPFVFDTRKMAEATAFSGDMIPWGQIAVLFLAGILLSFFVSGYLVRIYRGVTVPPEFDNWAALFVDGIKLTVVSILWLIPLLVVGAALIVTLLAGFSNGNLVPEGVSLAIIIVLCIITIIVAVITVFYSVIGIVRFARTGSIREGLRFSAITETLRAIGWAQYIVALIVLFVISFAFFFVMSIFSIIPALGAVVHLLLTPFYSVFSARYFSRVYDHGVAQASV